jgi:hypothetical protein
MRIGTMFSCHEKQAGLKIEEERLRERKKESGVVCEMVIGQPIGNGPFGREMKTHRS